MIGLVAMGALVIMPLGCGGGGGGGSAVQSNPSAFPTTADKFEGSTGDNTPANAGAISVGETQVRTIYPDGDVDWVKVNLTAGTEYEISMNNLSVNSDGYMYLYDTDGVTELDNNDDYLDLDPELTFTPSVTGTYYIRAMTYNMAYDGNDNGPVGVTAYTLGVREYVDGDNDTYSTYYDCNDSDNTIYPGATEIPGDGIDQDCDGVDTPLGTAPDSAEGDSNAASAVPMLEASGAPWEEIYRGDSNTANIRTIYPAGDVDWFSFEIPAYGQFWFTMIDDNISPGSIDATVYDTDGTTVITTGTSHSILNTTSSAKTYYIAYEAGDGTSTGYYLPGYYDFGVDADGDGYYTQDWDTDRDCNDGEAGINPGAADSSYDGIDQDCDGSDGPYVSISGTVFDPEADAPVGNVTVGAYRLNDLAYINYDISASTAGTGSFTISGIPAGVEIFLKASDSGFVTMNSMAVALTTDVVGADMVALANDGALVTNVANHLTANNEPAWNSTLMAYGYVVMDAEDTFGDDLAGLTVTANQGMGVLYNNDMPGGSGTFVNSPPTVARATTNMLPQMGGTVAAGSPWLDPTFTGSLTSGTLEESAIHAPVFHGEFTYFEWYQQ